MAPIGVRKLPSWGEQEHLNSELLQQPACVAGEEKFEVSFLWLWKLSSLGFSVMLSSLEFLFGG